MAARAGGDAPSCHAAFPLSSHAHRQGDFVRYPTKLSGLDASRVGSRENPAVFVCSAWH